jgi:hypothetical protein
VDKFARTNIIKYSQVRVDQLRSDSDVGLIINPRKSNKVRSELLKMKAQGILAPEPSPQELPARNISYDPPALVG